MVLDAHQHFWKYNPQRHGWINDDMAILKRDYLPPDLEKELHQHGLSGCIAVQAEQSDAETEFLLACANEHEFIKGIVGWIDLRSDNVERKLEEYAEDARIKGFRHVLQDEADPEFILDKKFQKGLKLLRKFNFTYDILIFPHQMQPALKSVELNPDQKFVIDHIAKPDIKHQRFDGWEKSIRAFAKHENVYCKVSGMVTEANWLNWKYEHFEPYLDVVFDAFGPQRILYGSDWPVCLLAASYSKVKNIIDEYIESFSPNEKKQVMGQTAIDFYNIV